MNWPRPATNNGDARFAIGNRKYLGSKRELAALLTDKIVVTSGIPEVFFDAFVGTGAISAALIERGAKKIIACDNLFSNTVIFKGFFRLPVKDEPPFEQCVRELNGLEGREGYITRHFADTYFSRPNCLRMDAIRQEIENKKTAGLISNDLWQALVASFLLAADRVANTLGQYDAFLKHMGKHEYLNGRHVIDARVYEPFQLRLLVFFPPIEHEVYTDDIFNVLTEVEAKTVYLDPPYNQRQYCDNYHVLENLARWERPLLYGKTLKFRRTHLKSLFSRKRTAFQAMERLLKNLRAQHVYLSYNSEGILSREEILSLINNYGLKQVWDIPYPVFGKGAGVSNKRLVTEYLFYFIKGTS